MNKLKILILIITSIIFISSSYFFYGKLDAKYRLKQGK